MPSTLNAIHNDPSAARRYRWTVEGFHKLTPGILDEDARVELIEQAASRHWKSSHIKICTGISADIKLP